MTFRHEILDFGGVFFSKDRRGLVLEEAKTFFLLSSHLVHPPHALSLSLIIFSLCVARHIYRACFTC
jgi:hypothetical protein